jgi:hypothetical protein
MSLQRYHELLLAQVEVMEQVGVTIEDKCLVESIATGNLRNVPNEADRAAATEQVLAIRFTGGTNGRYKSYTTHVQNSFWSKMITILQHYIKRTIYSKDWKWSIILWNMNQMILHLQLQVPPPMHETIITAMEAKVKPRSCHFF